MFVKLTLDSKTNFNCFKNNTENFFLNHIRARFYRILCILARRPVVLPPPTLKCLQPWWCNGIVTLCPGTVAPLHPRNMSQWGPDTVVLVWNNPKRRLCAFSNHDIHHPFSKDTSQIHLCSRKASLSITIKMPQWDTHSLSTFWQWSRQPAEAWLPKNRGRLAYALWSRLCVRVDDRALCVKVYSL